jgi:hypothetical protein
MNLVRVAEILKNASDQSLAQELNNPSGGVPSYMVLSELERRKKLRGSMMQPTDNRSVSEELGAEFGGLGALQGADQYASTVPAAPAQAEAPQGFAEGGVVGYANGGDVGSFEDYSQVMGMNRPSIWGYSSDIENQRKRQELMAQGLTRAQADAVISGKVAAPQAAPTAPQAAPKPAPARAAAAVANAPSPKTSATMVSAETGVAPDDVMARYRDIGKQVKDAYATQADMLRQQADEIKNQKSSDIGFALMQAGLGIAAGRSSNAITNIGEGAMPAMQQYIGMDRERRKEAQRLAMAQGQTGIASLEAQQKTLGAEGEYGLGERKLGIMSRSADADMIRARAAAAGVANQASQWKQDNAQDRVNQQRANSLINYLKTEGINLDEGTKAQYVAEINRLLGVSGTMSGIPQGVTVSRIKP